MILNRMGDTRRSNRRAWLTGTLTLGALAASGGVATAALGHSSGHRAPASQPSQSEEHSEKEGRDRGKARSQVCLRLDRKGQQAVAVAEAAAKDKSSVVVPMDKVEVIPCPRDRRGTPPSPTTSGPAEPTPTSSPDQSRPSATTPAPATTPPEPTVTSTAS